MKIQFNEPQTNFRGMQFVEIQKIASKYTEEIPTTELIKRLEDFKTRFPQNEMRGFEAGHTFSFFDRLLEGLNKGAENLKQLIREVTGKDDAQKYFAEQLYNLDEDKFQPAFKALTEGIDTTEKALAKTEAPKTNAKTAKAARGSNKAEIVDDAEQIEKVYGIDSEKFVPRSKKRKHQPKSNTAEVPLKNPSEQGVKKSEEERVTKSRIYPLVRDTKNKSWDACKREQKLIEKERGQLLDELETLEADRIKVEESIPTLKERVSQLKYELIHTTSQLGKEKSKMSKIIKGDYFIAHEQILGKKAQYREYAARVNALDGKDYQKLLEEHSKSKPQMENPDDIKNYQKLHKKWLKEHNSLVEHEKESHFIDHYRQQMKTLRNEIKESEAKFPALNLLNKNLDRLRKFANAENEANSILNTKLPKLVSDKQIKDLEKEIEQLNEDLKINQAVLAVKKGNPIPVEIDTKSQNYKLFSQVKGELEEHSQKRGALHLETERKGLEELQSKHQKLTAQIKQNQQFVEENASYNPANVIENLDQTKISFLKNIATNGFAQFLKSSKQQQKEMLLNGLEELNTLKNRQQHVLNDPKFSKSTKLQDKNTDLEAQIQPKQKFIDNIKSLVSDGDTKNFDINKIAQFSKAQSDLTVLEADLKGINLEKAQGEFKILERKYQDLTAQIQDKEAVLKGEKPVETGTVNINQSRIDAYDERIDLLNRKMEENQQFLEKNSAHNPTNILEKINMEKVKELLKAQNDLSTLRTQKNLLNYSKVQNIQNELEALSQRGIKLSFDDLNSADETTVNSFTNSLKGLYDLNAEKKNILSNTLIKDRRKFKDRLEVLKLRIPEKLQTFEINAFGVSVDSLKEMDVKVLDSFIKTLENFSAIKFAKNDSGTIISNSTFAQLKQMQTGLNSEIDTITSQVDLSSINTLSAFFKSTKEEQSYVFLKTLNELDSLESKSQTLAKKLELSPSNKLQNENKELTAEIAKRQSFVDSIKSLLADNTFDKEKVSFFIKNQNELKTLEAELSIMQKAKIADSNQLALAEQNSKKVFVNPSEALGTSVADKVDVEKINLYNQLVNKNLDLQYQKAQLESQMKKQVVTTELSTKYNEIRLQIEETEQALTLYTRLKSKNSELLSIKAKLELQLQNNTSTELTMRYKNILLQIEENEELLKQANPDFVHPDLISQRITAKEKELNRLKSKQSKTQQQSDEVNIFKRYLERKQAAGFPISFETLQDKLKVSLGNIFNKNKLENQISESEKLKEKVVGIQAPYLDKSLKISMLKSEKTDLEQKLESAQIRLRNAQIEKSSLDKKHAHLKKRVKIKPEENPTEPQG